MEALLQEGKGEEGERDGDSDSSFHFDSNSSSLSSSKEDPDDDYRLENHLEGSNGAPEGGGGEAASP